MRLGMLGIRMGALVLGIMTMSSGVARADWIAGGTTNMQNAGSTTHGYVQVAVYDNTVGGTWVLANGGGGGTSAADAAIINAAALANGGNRYLYLYQVVAIAPPPGTDISSGSVGTIPSVDGPAFQVAGSTFKSGGAAGAGADPAAFAAGANPGIATGAGTQLNGVGDPHYTPSSLAFSFNPALVPGGSSVLFGFTSPFAPAPSNTSIVDGGLNAQGVTLTPVPEPTSMALLGCGVVSMLGYGWKRRKVTA